jgi:hypothetical protein
MQRAMPPASPCCKEASAEDQFVAIEELTSPFAEERIKPPIGGLIRFCDRRLGAYSQASPPHGQCRHGFKM